MPELPEVETVMRGLAPVCEGQVIAELWCGEKGLRYPFPDGLMERLKGLKIKQLERRAKYIFMHLEDSRTLILHLGMSGRIRILQKNAAYTPEIHDHFRIWLANGVHIILNDARRFGTVFDEKTDLIPKNRFFKYLGPEPLLQEFNPEYLINTLRNKCVDIKTAIMDQRIVVGVGNIYASEALYRARISPRRKSMNVSKAKLTLLVQSIKDVLRDAIADGGSTLRDHRTAYGEFGYFQQRLSVYGRNGELCPHCTCDLAETGGIQKITQGGRATYFCSRRQT